MPYKIGFINKEKILREVLKSGGSFTTNPESFKFGLGINVGKVLLFCHDWPIKPQKMVVVVDNKEDLEREMKLHAEFVMVVKSFTPLLQELLIIPSPPPRMKEEKIPYWVN